MNPANAEMYPRSNDYLHVLSLREKEIIFAPTAIQSPSVRTQMAYIPVESLEKRT